MFRSVYRLMPQPLVAVLLGGLAVTALSMAWYRDPVIPTATSLLLALALAAAMLFTERHPMHVHYHTKVTIATVPIYLMALLLPPALAALVVCFGRLVGEVEARSRSGNTPSDIATCAARWLLVVLSGSIIAHLPASTPTFQFGLLLATALAMYAADLLTASLEIAPMSGEPPLLLLRSLFREGSAVEGMLYVIGILAGLAALHTLWALSLLVVPFAGTYRVFSTAKELRDSTVQMLEQMADAVDLRDPYTGGHSRRVTDGCAAILRALGLQGEDAGLIIAAARVHDIGKIGIPDGILNKPGPLTPEERAVMETHAALGAEFLARYPDFARGVAIVRHHHERWDGQGYPDGKAGHTIPFGARVMAVADSFDAMTSDRPYRRGMQVAKACTILQAGAGSQWDPAIVAAFLQTQMPATTTVPSSHLGEPPAAHDVPKTVVTA